MIKEFESKIPKIGKGTFVAENASLIGNVEIGSDCGVWFGAVIRGDSNTIRIGNRTNVQDLSIIHAQEGHKTEIGDDVTIGHRAIIHGCKIGNRCLVGMGAIIMNGVEVGENSIIGAGALVTEGQIIPPKSLVIGFPAKVKRELNPEEIEPIVKSADLYVDKAKRYLSAFGDK